jgi:hypothetical protein
MPLQRISAQRSGTLVDFYSNIAKGPTAEFGAMMLELIAFLNSHLTQTVWALTSHYSLWLLSSDDYRSGWHIELMAMGSEGYRIRYRLPESQLPWENAMVEGMAKDKERALEYVLVAMERSNGWPERGNMLSYAELDQVLIPWAESVGLFIATTFKDEDVRAVRIVDDQADSYIIAVFPSWGGKVFVNVSEDSVGKKRQSQKKKRVLSLETALPKVRDTLDTGYFVALGWICEKGHTRTPA